MCQVENIPVIQNLNDDQMLMEYTFLADQFEWLQDQKHPQQTNDDSSDNDEETGPLSPKQKSLTPLNAQLVKFFEHYMACLVRRLDGIKRMKAKQPDSINNFNSQELRDYQRESYQFRIKLGRLRQLRLNNGQLGTGPGMNINSFIEKNGLRYNFQAQDANEIINGVKTEEGDGEKGQDKDDLNDTKVDKNEKAEKEKKRQALRGKYISFYIFILIYI